MIDVLASKPWYVSHLAPIWEALGRDAGAFHVSAEARAAAAGIRGATRAPVDAGDVPILTVAYADMATARKAGRTRLALGQHGAGQCLAPDTRVLTEDLQYAPVASLRVGDRLVAFDETARETNWRRWQSASVTATRPLRLPCYRLHLADGSVVIASASHLWLARDRQMYEWTRTDRLQSAGRHGAHSSKLVKCFQTWDEDHSWGAGYLAAAFDGEGSLTQTPRSERQNRTTLTFSQKPNAMLDLVGAELASRGFRFSVRIAEPERGVASLDVLGGTAEVLRFVGAIRPRRLLAKMRPLTNGQMRGRPVEVLWSEPIGEREVIGLETSTGTLIAEGFATHNSYLGAGGVRNPSYPGGGHQEGVGLFLVPNETAARVTREAYPDARTEVVGCARLDDLPARRPDSGEPVVAISTHWDARVSPESQSAWRHYRATLLRLGRTRRVIGHAHPRMIGSIGPLYRAAGIEVVASFDEVLERADLYVCDNSSSMFEFAAAGRPVVVLNAPGYRRDVNHGLRFWDAAGVGVNVDGPKELATAIDRALELRPADVAARERALSIVYQPRHGAARLAASALRDWARL